MMNYQLTRYTTESINRRAPQGIFGVVMACALVFALLASPLQAFATYSYSGDAWELSWNIGGDSQHMIEGEGGTMIPDPQDFQYTSATWFYQFTEGNYTGTNAACGVDISSHNGTVDWAQLKSDGVDFAIIRCGYGDNEATNSQGVAVSQDDVNFISNITAARAAGLKVGIYIYSYALKVNGSGVNAESAESEALHCLRMLNEAGLTPADLDYPVYWDVEDSSQIGCDLVSMAVKFCTTIENAGYEAGIYSSKDWFENALNSTALSSYPKWIAQWSKQDTGLTYAGFSNFATSQGTWQFTARGYNEACSGHGHRIDLNYSFYQKPAASKDVTISLAGLNTTGKIYVDGVGYTPNAQGTITLPTTNATMAVAYTYNSTQGDVNTQYPTGMYVWTLSHNGKFYTATRTSSLDNILEYGGCSIRITGKKGIRMSTYIPEAKKAALTSAAGLAGYTLEEYGTIVMFDSDLGSNDITFDVVGVKSGSAYVRGSKDAVFAIENGKVEFTNVLTWGSTVDCSKTIAMRPYMKLRNASGNITILYGGTLHKSIGYVANQNKDEFAAGSDAYNFIHDILRSIGWE